MSSNLFVSSSPSSPPSLSSWPTTLEACECVRESKRAQLSVLWTRQQAIACEMKALETELNSLDEHMDQLHDALQEQQQEQQQEHQQEELPDPNDDKTLLVRRPCHSPLPTTRCSPSEILTDPTTVAPSWTQQQQHPQNDNDAQFMPQHDNHGPAVFQPPRRVTNIQPAAPLELNRQPPRHDINSNNNNKASTATTTTVHMSLSVATTTTTTTSSTSAPSKQHRYHDEVHRLLRQTFGLNNFRHQQDDIIYATLDNSDVFVVMRTGGGKSLTYQLPALLQRPKITLVVSPLVSLMADQVTHMNNIAGPGSAVCLSAGMGAAASKAAWDAIRNTNGGGSGGVCLVLVTPERVHQSHRLRHELQKLAEANRLARFVIDEAHCASQWGISFRPDYAKLGILKRHFPTVPLLAVTATASSVVTADVCRILGLSADTTTIFRSTANRPNLRYSVRPKPLASSSSSSSSSMMMMMVAEMATFIREHHAHDSGIIYTLSRKNADSIASALCQQYGIAARAYHSHVRHKETIQRDWMNHNDNDNNKNNRKGSIQVMVATIAFGLGINKGNVRFVLHETMSQNLDSYYQESGRAGRDGQDAHCILWYSPKDVPRIRAMVEDTPGGAKNLWPMVRYGQAFGNDAVCRAILLSALGEPNAPSPRQTLQQHGDATTRVKDVGKHGQIVTRLVHEANQSGDQVTQAMVLKTWRATKNVPTYVEEHPPKDLNAFECEQIIVSLLLENILEYHVHWTAYQAVAYLRLGRRGVALLQSANPKMLVRFPLAATSSSTATTGNNRKNATAPSAKKTLSTEWVTSGNGKKKPTAKTSKKGAPKKAAKKATAAKAVKKTTRKSKTNRKPAAAAAAAAAAVVASNTIQSYLAPKAKEEDVIVLSSDEDDDDNQVFVREEAIVKRKPRATRKRSRSEILWEDSKDTDQEEYDDDDDDDDDEEFEF